MTTTRLFWIALAFLCVAVGAVACGDDDDDGNDESTICEDGCRTLHDCKDDIVAEMETKDEGHGEEMFADAFGETVSACVEGCDDPDEGLKDATEACMGCFDAPCDEIFSCLADNCQ